MQTHTYCTFSHVELYVHAYPYVHAHTESITPKPRPPSLPVHMRTHRLWSVRGDRPAGHPAPPSQTTGTAGAGGWDGIRLPANLPADLLVCAELLVYRTCGPCLSSGGMCCLSPLLLFRREFGVQKRMLVGSTGKFASLPESLAAQAVSTDPSLGPRHRQKWSLSNLAAQSCTLGSRRGSFKLQGQRSIPVRALTAEVPAVSETCSGAAMPLHMVSDYCFNSNRYSYFLDLSDLFLKSLVASPASCGPESQQLMMCCT